jgi:TonB family protein
MKSLKLAKKLFLATAAVIALTLPLLAGLTVQQAAFAQQNAGTEEYLPIVKVAPVYPQRAAARGVEGYVIVQYTVNTDGSTEDIVVIESTSSLFDRAAVDSAAKYKYRPRIVNGAPVAVPGVTTKILFALEDVDLPVNPPGAAE